MTVSDPVADFLTRIRNGIKARKRFIDVDWSKIKQNIAEILKNQGFIESYITKVEKNRRGTIRVFLKYAEGRRSAITGIKRMSKPGLRKYVGSKDIPQFYGGFGLSIVSTSQGLMPGNEAIKKGIGGELLALVW